MNCAYYKLRRVYNNYFVYAVYDTDDVFVHRLNFITFAFLIYLAIGMLILIVQRHFDKVSLNKMELEPIKPSRRLDENGNIQALLVTTRDITSVKQTEELSFKDKLTGLHNRNYMEFRSKKGVRAGDLPVSLIMADCNYLKRTAGRR